MLDPDGRRVAPEAIGIVDGSTKAIRWAWSRDRGLAVDRPPSIGDDIYVFHSAFGVAQATIASLPFRETLRLPRPEGTRRFRIVDGTGSPLPGEEVRLCWSLPGGFLTTPATSSFTRPIDVTARVRTGADGTIDAIVPAGIRLSPELSPFGRTIRYDPASATGTGESVIRVTPYRQVDVRLPADGKDTELVVVVDRTAIASMPDWDRHAANVAVGVNAPPSFVAGEARAGTLRNVPPVPVTVFGRSGDRMVHARIDPTRTSLDLADAGPPVSVEAEPTLDRRPIPEGTVVLPGAHDLVGVADALHATSELRGGAVVRRARGPWRPRSLPACEVVTLWHPDAGLAHVRWDGRARIEGISGPCRVRFVAPGRRTAAADGKSVAPGRFSGEFRVWEDLVGPRAAFVRPGAPGLLRRVNDVTECVAPGLPPGDYCVEVNVPAAPGDARPPGLRTKHVTLSLERPEVVIDVDDLAK